MELSCFKTSNAFFKASSMAANKGKVQNAPVVILSERMWCVTNCFPHFVLAAVSFCRSPFSADHAQAKKLPPNMQESKPWLAVQEASACISLKHSEKSCSWLVQKPLLLAYMPSKIKSSCGWLVKQATHIQQACVEHLWHQKKQISNVCKKHAPKKHISFCNFLHCIHTKLSFAKAFSIKENGCSFPTYLFGFLFLLEHVKHICCIPATHIYIYIAKSLPHFARIWQSGHLATIEPKRLISAKIITILTS